MSRSTGFGIAAAMLVMLLLAYLVTSLMAQPDSNSLFLANWGIDFSAYWLAGQRALQGQSPYALDMLQGPFGAMGQDLFRYPPPFALAVSPLALLPLASAKLVWAGLSAAGLFVGCWLAASAGGAPRSVGRVFWTIAALGAFFPVFFSIWLGNVEGIEVLALGAALACGPVISSFSLLSLGILKVAPVLAWPSASLHFKKAFWLATAVATIVLVVTLPLLWQAWRDFPAMLINQLGGSSDYWANLAPAQLVRSLAPGNSGAESLVRLISLVTCAGLFGASIRYSRLPGGWPAALFSALVASLLLPSVIWLHYLALLLPFAFFVWPATGRLGRLMILFAGQLAVATLVFPPAGFLLVAPLVITLMLALRPSSQIRKSSA